MKFSDQNSDCLQESSEDTQYQPDEPAATSADASSGKLQAAVAPPVTAMS